eukprot:TRINITY_DN1192_c0_g1_i1.p1 TRINITY_DN1192_c0_g1~~TRINITY_DN1192_c0_g1_i1.p1  ORF type:complete len:753 (+),score=233.94 TRINITY_DN1192_c0_g1_i1:72-2330(+)
MPGEKDGSDDNIQVFIRIKPEKDLQESCLEIDGNQITCTYEKENGNLSENTKSFSNVFVPGSKTKDVYDVFGKKMIDGIMDGYSGTVFAYGQTGAGKSYTMFEDTDTLTEEQWENWRLQQSQKQQKDASTESQRPTGGGISNLLFLELFNRLEACKNDELLAAENVIKYLPNKLTPEEIVEMYSFSVSCTMTFIEIYKKSSFNLLDPKKPRVNIALIPMKTNKKRKEVVVMDDNRKRISIEIKDIDDVWKFFAQGIKLRAVRSHDQNQSSSRSHAVLILEINQYWHNKKKMKDPPVQIISALKCVDLAGSEKFEDVSKNSNLKPDELMALQKEGTAINSGLTFLSQVLDACAKGKKLIEYRNHELTTVLADSIGGSASTVMLAMVREIMEAASLASATLNYAARASTIKNKKESGASGMTKVIQEYNERIARLEAELEEYRKKGDNGQLNQEEEEKYNEITAQLRDEMEEKDREMQEMRENYERDLEEARLRMEKTVMNFDNVEVLVDEIDDLKKQKKEFVKQLRAIDNEMEHTKVFLKIVTDDPKFVNLSNEKKHLQNSMKDAVSSNNEKQMGLINKRLEEIEVELVPFTENVHYLKMKENFKKKKELIQLTEEIQAEIEEKEAIIDKAVVNTKMVKNLKSELRRIEESNSTMQNTVVDLQKSNEQLAKNNAKIQLNHSILKKYREAMNKKVNLVENQCAQLVQKAVNETIVTKRKLSQAIEELQKKDAIIVQLQKQLEANNINNTCLNNA